VHGVSGVCAQGGKLRPSKKKRSRAQLEKLQNQDFNTEKDQEKGKKK